MAHSATMRISRSSRNTTKWTRVFLRRHLDLTFSQNRTIRLVRSTWLLAPPLAYRLSRRHDFR